jgi:hypothetical protein
LANLFVEIVLLGVNLFEHALAPIAEDRRQALQSLPLLLADLR